MLVVFDSLPRSSPTKTVLDEQAITEVGGVDERYWQLAIGGTVGGIGFSVGRLYFAIIEVNVRVVERIDIDGKSLCVLGEFCGTTHNSKVEA